ncbi:MAG: YbjQ family protein [Hyphomicrobiaceae bacterium]
MRLVTTDRIDDAEIVTGEVVYAVAVSGANIVRDMREAIINTIGGRMTRYEDLVDMTIARALEALKARAAEQGYDGVLAVRLSHPMITNGAVEVVATGTGFRYASKS